MTELCSYFILYVPAINFDFNSKVINFRLIKAWRVTVDELEDEDLSVKVHGEEKNESACEQAGVILFTEQTRPPIGCWILTGLLDQPESRAGIRVQNGTRQQKSN